MAVNDTRPQTNRATTAAALEDQRVGKSARNWYGANGAVTANRMEFCGTKSLLRYGDRPEFYSDEGARRGGRGGSR
jgi:hypothetical protein